MSPTDFNRTRNRRPYRAGKQLAQQKIQLAELGHAQRARAIGVRHAQDLPADAGEEGDRAEAL
jgi:hypothetical protein